jgi:acyl carrier protein
LAADLTELTVAAVDWSVFKPVYTRRIGTKFLERMPDALPAVASGETTEVMSAPTTRRWTTREELEQVVCDYVAEILGTDARQVARSNEGFFAMGMDSIMTVELRNRMETLVGRRLPTTLAFEYPTVDKLAQFLFGEPDAAAVAPAAVRKPETQVPADLDDLSEDELAQLLDADLRNADDRVAP